MGTKAFPGVIVISIGLISRVLAAFCATFGARFKWKERVFIAFAWIPKATVQVRLALHAAVYRSFYKHNEHFVETVGYFNRPLSAELCLALLKFY